MFSLPEKFEEFSEARRNGFIKAKELKENGGRFAGIFCTFTPLEIFDAAGVIPVSLCGMSDETIPAAEVNLPKNLCPLIKSSYGFAVSDKCPYTYFSDIIVGETTCDGKKKMYEMLGELKDVYILHLPQGIDRPYALDMWKGEIILLKQKLEEKFGITITDDDVRKACANRNREREIKIRLFEMNKSIPPKSKYVDLHKVVDSLNFSFNREEDFKKIEEALDQIDKEYNEGSRPVGEKDKRILVTGCPISGVLDKTVGEIERNGGCVVVMDNCNGIKTARNMIDPNAPDIYEAIAKRYMNVACAVMTPNTNRMNQLRELVDEYKVDGVVDVVLQSCHPFDVEKYKISKLCKELNVPYLPIETDYSKTDVGQLSTRFQAFLEML